MVQSSAVATRATFSRGLEIVFVLSLLLVVPLVLSNRPAGTALSGLVVVVVFFFSGYALLAVISELPSTLRSILSPVVGMVCLTTAYDVFARASSGAYFFYLAAVISAGGVALFAFRIRREVTTWSLEGYRAVLAGGVAALTVAPLFWRSGRFADGEFVFRGPAGQDHLFHMTLLQRLLQHVPPDNFMFSGLRPAVYHYFDDLTLALILGAQHSVHLSGSDLFDLYYRCYPTLIYFLLGALAYFAGRQLLGTAKGGVLGVLLLLGAGGLGWVIGLLQTAIHATHLIAFRARLFSTWTSWDGVDAIRPLVHRPAHYHGLLICLAAVNILLRPERTRRHWLLAGLLLGLMAGYNFTLAATFGAAAVLGSVLFFLQRRQDDGRNLAWLALFTFIGSLPVNLEMLLSGFHNMAPGFPFRGPNLDFPIETWGMWLSRILPGTLVPWASLVVLVVFAYGVKLFGVAALVRLDLGEDRHRALGMLFAAVFAISFVIGTFFPYKGIEVGIIFLQPTLWILALFSLWPIGTWLQRNKIKWRAVAFWGMLGLTWAQALLAFNFSYGASFGQDTIRALQDVRSTATPQDVVAYLPSDLTQKAIWGYTQQSTNFAIMAMTGLDGYFSSEMYSKFNAVPGLSGKSPDEVLDKAEHLYEQRHADIESFIKGDITAEASARLANDHVRWIVVSGATAHGNLPSTMLWRRTPEISVYRLLP
jgi:hypothetical protein